MRGIFIQLNELLAVGDTANITVVKQNDKLILAVVTTNKERNQKWPPFTAAGTAEELESNFYDTFDQACSIIKEGNQTIDEFKKQVEQSAKSSEAGKKVEAQTKARENEAKTKAQKETKALTEKAEEFFKKKEYAKARLYYTQALDYATKYKLDTKAINAKIAECNSLDTPSLFGEVVTQEPTANTNTENSVLDPEESDPEFEDDNDETFDDFPDGE